MESVRVQLSGNRIKAYGRIVAAATPSHPAFSASYDLVTDETGATKRLSMTVTLAERERQLSIARDEENMWLVQQHTGETSRAAYGVRWTSTWSSARSSTPCPSGAPGCTSATSPWSCRWCTSACPSSRSRK